MGTREPLGGRTIDGEVVFASDVLYEDNNTTYKIFVWMQVVIYLLQLTLMRRMEWINC